MAEFASVVLCVAMIIGIGVPIYSRIVKKASSVTATRNIASGQQAVDVFLSETLLSSPGGGIYEQVDAGSLCQSVSGINWMNLDAGDSLQSFGALTSDQKNSVFVVKPENPDEICLFVITLDKNIISVRGINGIWEEEVTVPYKQGIPGIVLIGE